MLSSAFNQGLFLSCSRHPLDVSIEWHVGIETSPPVMLNITDYTYGPGVVTPALCYCGSGWRSHTHCKVVVAIAPLLPNLIDPGNLPPGNSPRPHIQIHVQMSLT